MFHYCIVKVKVKVKVETNLYSAIKSEDSEALDGGYMSIVCCTDVHNATKSQTFKL